MKTVLLPLALVASLGAGAPASASSLFDLRRVPYSPAELRTDEDVRALERRVAGVVHRTCLRAARRPMHERAAIQSCIRRASGDAREQIAEAVRLARTTAATAS